MLFLEIRDSKACGLELWSDIEGYEGLYQVSTYGNVRSLIDSHQNKRSVPKILKAGNNGKGYLLVYLSKDGKRKMFKVHRLVAQAFLYCKDRDSLDINHKDENPTNNRIENLEYCTRGYNINYGNRNQRVAEKKSKQVNQLTLSGDLIKTWTSAREAGRNGFNVGNISSCCNGKLKTHAGFKWQYA